MEFEFNTTLNHREIDIYNFPLALTFNPTETKLDFDTKGKANVVWSITPDVRTWGINGMYVIIKSVKIEIEWYVYTEDISTKEEKDILISFGGKEDKFNGKIEGLLEIDTDLNAWLGERAWIIQDKNVLFEGNSCQIGNCEIDFKTGILTFS